MDSQSEGDINERKRKQLASKLLLEFSKKMPEEPTLMEQLNSVVKEKQAAKSHQDSIELNETTKGIYREVKQRKGQLKGSDFEI